MVNRATNPKKRAHRPPASAKTLDAASGSAARAELYRRVALALPEAVEASHMGAPDFRVNGRIFATLAYKAKGLGTVMLDLEQQAGCLADAPEYFTPAPGKWGQNGTTLIRLDSPDDVIADALRMAHHNVLKRSAGDRGRRLSDV
jgi:hypothetical protein